MDDNILKLVNKDLAGLSGDLKNVTLKIRLANEELNRINKSIDEKREDFSNKRTVWKTFCKLWNIGENIKILLRGLGGSGQENFLTTLFRLNLLKK